MYLDTQLERISTMTKLDYELECIEVLASINGRISNLMNIVEEKQLNERASSELYTMFMAGSRAIETFNNKIIEEKIGLSDPQGMTE